MPFLYRSTKTHIKRISATIVAPLAKPAPGAFVYHKWTKRRKYELAKHCRKTCRNNKCTVAAQRCANKYPAQRPVWHLRRCRVWKLSIRKRPNVQTKQMQSISQTLPDFCRSARNERNKSHFFKLNWLVTFFIYILPNVTTITLSFNM